MGSMVDNRGRFFPHAPRKPVWGCEYTGAFRGNYRRFAIICQQVGV